MCKVARVQILDLAVCISHSFNIFGENIVIYWPSTKPSIKRCTCVNKRKNSGSRWVLNNNITRCTDGSSQLETRCRSESQRQTEGFGLSVTPGWETPAKMRKKCCYGQKNLGKYSSLSLSPAHLSHITNITLSRIKCERFIFKKKCIRSFNEVRHYVWLCSAYICMWVYNNMHPTLLPPAMIK